MAFSRCYAGKLGCRCDVLPLSDRSRKILCPFRAARDSIRMADDRKKSPIYQRVDPDRGGSHEGVSSYPHPHARSLPRPRESLNGREEFAWLNDQYLGRADFSAATRARLGKGDRRFLPSDSGASALNAAPRYVLRETLPRRWRRQAVDDRQEIGRASCGERE